VSREFQTEAVRRLAGLDADRLRIIDADWGRSASTDKTGTVSAFLALLDDVERGQVSTLYAYSTDRLARSVEWAARLLNACRRANVAIVTSEGRFDPDNQMTDQLFYFQAMQNEGYSRQASQKRRATVAIQKARGDILGQKPYGSLPGEDAQAVVAAFREAGSYHGAARLLIERGVPSRRAHLGGEWVAGTVKRIIAREQPGLVPVTTRSGAKTLGARIFSRLLVCGHDGTTLTSMGRTDASPAYLCRAGHRSPPGRHPRPVHRRGD
jgi:DNA invertase Pin-like site-specific DNA recombinase